MIDFLYEKLTNKIINSNTIFNTIFAGCSQKESKLEMLPNISKAKVKRIEFKDIKGFYEDDLSLAFEVFKKRL